MRHLYWIALILVMSGHVSCTEIFEEDITNDSLVVLGPADGIQTERATQTFWWEEDEEAIIYNLQIVEPTFDTPERLVLDTNLSEELFKASLQPGQYQWRVRGENGAYESRYVVRSIQVDSTVDLSQQEILLLNPSDALVYDAPNIDGKDSVKIFFKWGELVAADRYILNLIPEKGQPITKEVLGGSTSIPLPLTKDTYRWTIRAENDDSKSPFSTERTFFVDTTRTN